MSIRTNQLGTTTYYGKATLASKIWTAILASGGDITITIGMRLQHTEDTTAYGLLDIGDSSSGNWDALCNIQKVNGGSQIRSYFANSGTPFATFAYPTWTASTWRTLFFRVVCENGSPDFMTSRSVWRGTYSLGQPQYTQEATDRNLGSAFDAAWLGTQRFGTGSVFNTFSDWKIAEMCVWGGSGLTSANHQLATGQYGGTPYSFGIVQPADIIDYSSFRSGLDGSGWTVAGSDTEDLPNDNPELIWSLATGLPGRSGNRRQQRQQGRQPGRLTRRAVAA